MQNVTVKEIYKTFTVKPPVVPESAKIEEVIRILLQDPKSRSVYIVNSKNKLIGIISTLIILKTTHIIKGKKTVAKEDVFNALKISRAREARDIMHPPIYVYENDKILDVLEKMSSENIQELPVVDKDKHVLGDLNCLEILKKIWEI